MSATFVEAFRQSGSDPSDSNWAGWLKRELAPTHAREIRTAIIVAGAVLCVIISMTLQVPQLATSAYMVFFISKESKLLTTITGVGGVLVLTIGIAGTLLLYKFTYGHPELRIPGMAIALFLGMWLSRVLVMGPLGFLLGFVVAVSQSVGEEIPSPEYLVRQLLWLWVALTYAIALTVVLNLWFLPDTPKAATPRPKPKSLFVPDAFTNPAHVHFALKVTFAAMFCYIVYEAIDWSGIHTAFITCTFIALESTEATLYKGTLRFVGCLIGGALALFSIVFLMPHMETIASLVVVVACASAVAGWVAAGSERISYAGLQMAFAFFYSVFQGYAPDTDLDNVRNRVSGPSALESNRRPHNEIVEEYRLCVVDFRIVRLRSSRDGENNATARSDNRLERRATQRRDRMLDTCGARRANSFVRQRSLGRKALIAGLGSATGRFVGAKHLQLLRRACCGEH